jgi:LCP family protein required for cell wall assembly
MIERPHQRRPAVAAFLSFLFPGLGQAYAGDRRLAALLALPVLALIAAGIVAFALGGRQALNSLLSSSFLSALVALDVALLGWRLFAIAQVGFAQPSPARATVFTPPETADRPWSTRRAGTILVVSLLLVITIAMHAWAGLLVGQLNTTLGSVFSGGGHGVTTPNGQGGGGPLNRPDYAWDGTDRINFLLLGIDARPGRPENALTDTILAISVDPVTKTAVMISVPRDTGFMPLPDRSVYPDGLYPHKINALSTEASEDPALWCPDLAVDAAEACGLRTLQRTVGLYLGIPIHYYATIDLLGFTQMIDAVGGLTLCLPGKLVDSTYNPPGDFRPGQRGIELPAGCTHYDGPHALAYARARKGYIEMPDGTQQQLDDFKRADRQQQVLLELRREFAKLDLFFELPDTLAAIGSTVTTDFPRGSVGDLASLLPLITGPDIERIVLDLPRFVDPPVNPNANYMLIARRDDVREEMERLFGAENLEGWYVGTRRGGPET